MLSNDEIREHPILDDEFRQIAKHLQKIARERKEPLPPEQLAEVMLRGAARNYSDASERHNATGDTTRLVQMDRELRRAALLYAYETIKGCEAAIVSEYPHLDDALELFKWVALEAL